MGKKNLFSALPNKVHHIFAFCDIYFGNMTVYNLQGRFTMISNDVWLLLQSMMFFIGSISDMGTLPDVLSAEEEKALLEELKNGNQNAKKKLTEHNLKLVVHIAKRFANTDIDIDDLISIGTIGLIKAIENFNTQKQVRLATFASTCIENEILMTLRAAKKDSGNVVFSDCLGCDDEGNEMVYGDILGTDDDGIYEQLESRDDISKMLKLIKTTLTDMERTVLELRYGLKGHIQKGKCGLTQQAVADKLDISRSYVSRIETKALEKLAKKFGVKQ